MATFIVTTAIDGNNASAIAGVNVVITGGDATSTNYDTQRRAVEYHFLSLKFQH